MRQAYEQLEAEMRNLLREANGLPDLDERRAAIHKIDAYFGDPNSRTRALRAKERMKYMGYS